MTLNTPAEHIGPIPNKVIIPVRKLLICFKQYFPEYLQCLHSEQLVACLAKAFSVRKFFSIEQNMLYIDLRCISVIQCYKLI